MIKRYVICGGIVAACTCLALAALTLLTPRPGVTKANFDRVKMGMTKEEIEEVFGEKGTIIFDTGQVQFVIWEAADNSRAEIEFVEDGAVPKRWVGGGETPIDMIRRWFGDRTARPKPAMRTGP